MYQTLYIRMDYTNEFQDLQWSIKGTGANTDVITGAIPKTSTKTTVTLVTNKITKNSVAQTFNYTLTITLPNLDKNQDYDQGKRFSGTLYADLGDGVDMIYYNNTYPKGITTKPQ